MRLMLVKQLYCVTKTTKHFYQAGFCVEGHEIPELYLLYRSKAPIALKGVYKCNPVRGNVKKPWNITKHCQRAGKDPKTIMLFVHFGNLPISVIFSAMRNLPVPILFGAPFIDCSMKENFLKKKRSCVSSVMTNPFVYLVLLEMISSMTKISHQLY